MPRPPLKEFLEDPKHQSEREFLDGYLENYLTRKAAEADRRRRENPEDDEPENLFDYLFGSWKK